MMIANAAMSKFERDGLCSCFTYCDGLKETVDTGLGRTVVAHLQSLPCRSAEDGERFADAAYPSALIVSEDGYKVIG